jgi:ribonuclease G
MIYPFTELNLIQIARKRRGKQILEYIEEKCQCCRGKGSRIRFSYMKELIKNDVTQITTELGVKDIYIQIGDSYKDDVLRNSQHFADEIGAQNFKLYVKFIENMEFYKVEPLIFPNHIEKLQKFKIYG